MNIIIELLIKALFETLYLTGIIILAGFLLGVLRNATLRNFQRIFGMKAVMITGFIGVPVHELSHAVFAVLFRHKITDIKLLQKPDINGVMGYVRHSYSKSSLYQQVGNFFIGVAPIFGGVLTIILLMKFAIPDAYIRFIRIMEEGLKITALNKLTLGGLINSYIDLIKIIFSADNFINPYFYLFIFASMCISSHISLSTADIKGASRGLGIIFIIILGINAFGLSRLISEAEIIKYNMLITVVLTIAIVLSFITLLTSMVFNAAKLN